MQKNSAPKTEYFEHLRPEMMKYIPTNASRILEVGCGSGLFVQQLKSTIKAEFWGVEQNTVAAKKSAEIFNKVLVGDVTKLLSELPNAYFDCIIFNDVLEHLVDPEQLLVAMKNKLLPNGVFVASIPNVRYVKNLFNLLVRKDWRYEDQGILDRTHLRFFTKKSLCRMLTEAGFQIKSCDGINPTKIKLFWIFYALTLGWARDTRYLGFACVFSPVSVI